MIDLESGYMRDQLMLEILLDIRDLFSVAPAASGGTRAGEAGSNPQAHQASLKGLAHAAMQSACLLAAGVWLSAACHSMPGSTTASGPADMVIYGRVWTGDSAKPWAQAVAIAGDTIAAVGDSAAVSERVGSRTRLIHNGKGMVAPGFMDAHVHLLSGGFQIARVDLRGAIVAGRVHHPHQTARREAFSRRVDRGW